MHLNSINTQVLDQVSPIAKEVPREEGYIDASIVNVRFFMQLLYIVLIQ